MSDIRHYKPSEVYNNLKGVLEANDKLIAKGQLPISVSLIGPHGIGKTTIVRELATEMGKPFFKLNLSQIQEVGELQGYFSKEYEVAKADKSEFVTENLLPMYLENGYIRTSKVLTKPCPPEWVANLQKGSVIIFDDMGRENSLITQAVMEILSEQQMIGWDLRSKEVQILCTQNPDNGEYNIQSTDEAQADRILKMHMKWDADDWAVRAEQIGTDARLINFVIWGKELFENKKEDGISASGQVSPRMMDKFFSLISTIDDFQNNLDKITFLGEISVGKNITQQLIKFINQKLDKLPEVDKLIKEYELGAAKTALTNASGNYEADPENFKGAVAAIMCTRLINYMKNLARNKELKDDNVRRYGELITHTAFTTDHKFLMGKSVMSLSNKVASIIGGNAELTKYIIS